MCSVMESVETLMKLTTTIKNELNSAKYAENVPLKSEYDFVIVGAGAAGCVLANRLSEKFTVLLLEAGKSENPMLTGTPILASELQATDYNWNYVTEKQENACQCTDLCDF